MNFKIDENLPVEVLDFADIRSYVPKEFSGLVVLRLERQDQIHVLNIVKRLTRVFIEKDPCRQLWVVEEHRIRIRS